MSRLFCAASGNGPTVILIHGWGLHSGVFDVMSVALAHHARVLAPDLPGHGRSPDPDSVQLDDWTRLVASCIATPPAIWVGWSLGAFLALRAASIVPEFVRALVLIAATPRFVQAPGSPAGMDPSVLTEFADELETDYVRTLSRFIALQFGAGAHEREAVRALRRALSARPPTPNGLRAGLAILQRTDVRDELARIRVPVRVIHGARDRLVPPAAAEFISSHVAQGRCEVIPGAGHAPFLTDADVVLRHIGELVNASP